MSKAKKAPAKKKVNGYEMPDPLPRGEILTDLAKKQYRLGVSIGKGGFGEIYSAQYADTKAKNYPYVIKIEPHANGPLFVEMHFYMRNAKEADINAFKASKKLKSLGMPIYIGSGSHEHGAQKYRFIVMEKFASDISKHLVANNNSFPTATVYKLGLQMIDVLEYIHGRGYTHADLKAANILLSTLNDNQAYLVDFGLAGKFTNDKVFKPDPKKMHDGTIEYLSRDAHQGVQTRRGDIEILAYNLIHWLGCKLPWEKNLTDPKVVQASKEKYMADVDLFMKTCFGSTVPMPIIQLVKYVNALKFDEEPDYKKISKLFETGLKDAGGTLNTPLQFKSTTKRKSTAETPEAKSKIRKNTNEDDEEGTPKRSTRKKLHVESTPKTDGEDTPKRRGGRKPIAKVNSEASVTPRKVKETDSSSDIENKVVKPKRRERRVNTISTVDSNGITHNPEMMRIQNLLANKKGANRKKKVTERLNKSLDIISASEDEEEILPISRRALRNKK